MPVVYPTLIGEIAKRGIKKTAIASHLGISGRCLYNKLCGVSSFTWEEICSMTDCFFPDMSLKKEVLFAKSDARDSA